MVVLLNVTGPAPISPGGVAPTANAFYFNPNRPVKTAAFIVGDFIYVHPNPRFFDENLKLKEILAVLIFTLMLFQTGRDQIQVGGVVPTIEGS